MSQNRDSKVKSLRVFQMDEYIRNGNYPSVAFFMDKFETSRRTIMRDLEFLQDRYEAPLAYDRTRGGYYYTEQNFFIKSVLLSEGELFTVSTILPLLEQYKNTPLESSFKNILGKMMDLLPDQVQVDSNLSTSGITFIKDPLPEIDEVTFTSIFDAIKQRHTIEFGYRSISKQEHTKRDFDPYNVLCQKGNWYVIGYCHKHQDFIVYALSRMNNVKILSDSFKIKPEFNIKNHIDPDFGIWNNKEEPQKIELLFSSNINTYILERSWHVNQECHQNEDGSVYLSFMSNQMQETLFWILHFGSAVKVINPPELKEKVAEEIKKMAKLY